MAGRATPAWRSPSLAITLGVSSCLLGEKVRYDGGDKKDGFVTGVLGRHFTWVSVCPEMEIGLGTPRETLRLVGDPGAPRLVEPRTGADRTEQMNAYARRRARDLARAGLSGYVLKRASPSCGMERVRVYTAGGRPGRLGRGLFARALMDTSPLLPVEEEGRLDDPARRDSFITRVFSYRRLTALADSDPRPADVAAFHAAHTFLLLSHSPAHHARLGRLVAAAEGAPRARWLAEYSEAFMAALAVPATPRKHVDVLRHILGVFTDRLGSDDRRELLGLIEAFGRGLVPLVVPITLINHHVRRLGVASVAEQIYPSPHPTELMLRYHI